MMRRPNRGMSKGIEGPNANAANQKRIFRTREKGGRAARQVLLGLIASLVVALPGSAQEFSGNHEFRGNTSSLSGASKTADGSTGVDGTSGTVTLSIPIAVPPGTGGLAPTLSLNYSSDQGDGPFGLGWNLQLGEIRCTARFGVPDDYASCPNFELDGQLLVGPDAQGHYHTKVESFQRIRLVNSGSSSPYWEVTSPGGTRRLYGETTDSKIGSDGWDTPSTAPTARWLLSKIVDLHDNEILITYDRSDVGVAYPSTITYALGEREVTFLYESRPDKILDYPGGIPRNITKRLREIEVKSLDTIFSRRLITYSESGDYATHRSRIASTQLFGRDEKLSKDCDDPNPVVNCAWLPAQTYEYTETTVDEANPYWEMAPSGKWEEAGILIETGFETQSFDLGKRLADVNGDGLPDLLVGYCGYATAPCEAFEEGPEVYINNGSDWIYDDPWTTAIRSLTYLAPTITVESVQYSSSGLGKWRACNATTGTVTRRISFADEEADWKPIAVDGNFRTFTPWPSWHLVDVNGDGFADLVTSVRGGVVSREFDCAGNPIEPDSAWHDRVLGGELSRVIFLNNGTGWDPAPAGMAESLPVFTTQTIVKHWKDRDSMFGGINLDCDQSGWLGGWSEESSYCTTYMDLRPQFVELNGDGLIDIIIQLPHKYGSEEEIFLWLDHFDGPGSEWMGAPSTSSAWIQNADGSGWTPAPNFDLPFAHIQYNWIEGRGFYGGGMQAYDAGVYFVDLNRDGLIDVVKDEYVFPGGVDPAAVLLGTGTGWCNDLGTWVSSDCDPETNHSRYVAPNAFNRYERDPMSWEWVSRSEQLVFGDVNGDGWVDLLQGKNEPAGTDDVLRAWLHDPSAPNDSGGNPSVWVEEPDFAPPTPFYIGTQFSDLDGNGTLDILHGWREFGAGEWIVEDAYLSPGTYSDLLASVANGRGGVTDFTYVSSVVQQDSAMEDDAEAHAATIGDADGNSDAVTRFTTKPMVWERTVSGVGIAANVTTQYRYARPRFDPIERSDLGFGLVETTNPDNSRVDVYYYQPEGLVGRPSVQETFDEAGNPIHHSEQTWLLASNPGSIPGAMAGVDVARLEKQESYNVYGLDEFGSSKQDVYSYDDSYGYNFISQVISTRATGVLSTTFTPDTEAYDEDRWLVGLVGEKSQLDAGVTYSREVYDYTVKGQLESRDRDIGFRDGSAASDVATTSWTYDSWGNVTSQTESRGKDAAGILLSPRVVQFCYDGDGGGGSWCPSPPGWAPDTHSLRMGTRDAIGGVVELEYDWVMGVVLHVERRDESDDFRDSMTVVRDAFGRVEEQWFRGASFGGGDPDVQLAATTYHDEPNGSTPAYIEQFQFTGKVGEDPIRFARYLDGFGNLFREVAKTPSGHQGTAVFRDPVARTVRSVGPIDCDSDGSCSNITKDTEPASEREVDAAGRVIRTTSPDDHDLIQEYSRELRAQPAGSGTGDVFDTVKITDPNGNTLRRLLDANRVVWVDECQGSTCTSPDSTFYTYEATGEISTIYDAIATDTDDYASPVRYLRYHYDTLGRVIRTDEPNTGSSLAEYDHQGNVTKTTNVRGMETSTYYDPLGRVTSIDRPAGMGEWDFGFTYDPISRKRESVTVPDPSINYSDNWEYDDFGQVKRQIRTFNNTMVMDFEYDLLGRPTKIYYPSSDSSVSYEYEGAYLTRVCRGDVSCATASSENRLITDVVYDGLGRREDVVMSSGTVHREYYDTDYVGSGGSINGLKRLAITAGTAAGALDFNYEYDFVGNIAKIDDESTTYDASATYTYDTRNRLKSWTDEVSSVTQWYTYDALGNLVGHGVGSEGGTNQTFDPATKPHQIETNRIGEDYAYDADGNVIKRGATHFVYDSANRLVCTGTGVGECNGPGYRYDADGQLLWDGAAGEQLMGDLFRWKSMNWNAYSNIVAFGEVIAEVRQVNSPLRASWAPVGWPLPIPTDLLLKILAGAAMLTWIALFAWLGAWRVFIEAPATATLVLALTALLLLPPLAWGGSLASKCGKHGCGGGGTVTTVRAFFRDHLGSTAYVTGPNVRQAYEPFGKVILAAGTKDEFTGKKYHNVTDMYYFGARWYDAEAGRFAGVDPLLANPGDPQSLNAYGYVRNDPVNLVDPTGMAAVMTPGIEEITITGTRGSTGAWGSGIKSMTVPHTTGMFRLSVPRGHNLPTLVQAGMILDGYVECCGADPNEGGDSPQEGADPDTFGNDVFGVEEKDDLFSGLGLMAVSNAAVTALIKQEEERLGRKLTPEEKTSFLKAKDQALLNEIRQLAGAYGQAEREFDALNRTQNQWSGLKGLSQIPRRMELKKVQGDALAGARGRQAIRWAIGLRLSNSN